MAKTLTEVRKNSIKKLVNNMYLMIKKSYGNKKMHLKEMVNVYLII